MKKTSIYLLLLGIILVGNLYGQTNSEVFSFAQYSPSARLTGLGQYGTALIDEDAGLALSNPASIWDSITLEASFQHGFLKPGIQFGRFYIADRIEHLNFQWIAGLSYSDHGEITQADPFGNRLGTFEAKSMSIFAGVSKRLYKNLFVGAQLEYLQGTLENYFSNGLATHWGILYIIPEKKFNIGLSWNQIGFQWAPFEETREDLRSNLQVAISKRLAHLPFRFSIIYHQLNHWNLLYDSPISEENILIIGQLESERSPFALFIDNFSRHLAINGEFFIGKKEQLRLRLGYDHQRRKELSINNWNSLAGFSAGFAFNIKRVSFDYGWASYHLSGGIHHIGIQYRVGESGLAAQPGIL